MSQSDKPTSTDTHAAAGASRRAWFKGAITGSVLGGLLAGGLGMWAHAHEGAEGPGGCHRMGPRALSPEAGADRIAFATDWVLEKIQATDAQREQVRSIVQATLTDLASVRDQHRKNRDALIGLLSQPTVDRPALEEIRRNEMQVAESASGRIVTALADVADVLTPEQRTQLARMIERWRR
jgi:Spy/CpxP family protein refolding chaperone